LLLIDGTPGEHSNFPSDENADRALKNQNSSKEAANEEREHAITLRVEISLGAFAKDDRIVFCVLSFCLRVSDL
jgi:hypothetical protein